MITKKLLQEKYDLACQQEIKQASVMRYDILIPGIDICIASFKRLLDSPGNCFSNYPGLLWFSVMILREGFIENTE